MSREFNKKLLALAMALLMLLICLPALAEGESVPEGYKPVAESSAFRLYLLEETMAVIIQSKENGSLLFASRGLGNSGPSFRLFNRPEVAVLTLHKG